MKPVDLLSIGLGAAFLAKDKFGEILEELETRGEVSKAEAKNLMEEAKARAKQEEEALAARVRQEVKKVLDEIGVATKDDIAELKALLQQKTD